MEYTTESLQRTMEVGYLAATYGMTAEAITIFEGVGAARPQSELPDLGLSFAYLCGNNAREAVRILTQVALAKNPDSAVAKSFIGLCLKQSGMTAEADSILEEVAAGDGDPVAREMAAALLKENFANHH